MPLTDIVTTAHHCDEEENPCSTKESQRSLKLQVTDGIRAVNARLDLVPGRAGTRTLRTSEEQKRTRPGTD